MKKLEELTLVFDVSEEPSKAAADAIAAALLDCPRLDRLRIYNAPTAFTASMLMPIVLRITGVVANLGLAGTFLLLGALRAQRRLDRLVELGASLYEVGQDDIQELAQILREAKGLRSLYLQGSCDWSPLLDIDPPTKVERQVEYDEFRWIDLLAIQTEMTPCNSE
eukprot:TRINITY_DN11834_c0_g1_i2.p1 TRINITY_DN11834_c0_g1~~TRINITY_DN11834_c0_g1_i2.p1  ORF type:complete len:166 (+),score=37.77 TRINITY_DN11834_c0_g1_i2:431-928(+)